MNELPLHKRSLLKRLLAQGASVRAIAAAVGCAKNTVTRYKQIWVYDVICACGKPTGHNGWCRARLEFSPERTEWLKRRWRARRQSVLSEAVCRAAAAAKEQGHNLGPFVWGSASAVSVAFAACRTCGKTVRVYPGDSQWERYRDWERHAGAAVTTACKTEAEKAAERAAHKEKREWRSAKRTLVEIKRHLRQPNSRTPESQPERTSAA